MKTSVQGRAIVAVALFAFCASCSQPQSAPLPTDTLPRLGQTKTSVESDLRGRGSDTPVVAYELHLVNQFVRTSVLYSTYSDGSIKAMQVNLRSRDGISDEAAREAKRQLLPPDIRVMKQNELNAAVLDDGEGLSPGADMAFLYSRSLGKKLASKHYYRRGWHSGACPVVEPGTIEEYTERENNQLNELDFYAVYLDKCQIKFALGDGAAERVAQRLDP